MLGEFPFAETLAMGAPLENVAELKELLVPTAA
jgi:hypothetical protein